MAIAEEIYADPSALAKFYIHEPQSLALGMWRGRMSGSLPVTHHGRIEVITTIALAQFRGILSSKEADLAWAAFAEDFADGYFSQVDILWRSALNRAAVLSREHSPQIGTRSMDVLHVACALELGVRRFLTFDARQASLATTVGLKLVSLP